MRYHGQNLNESPQGKIIGSMLWKGRAWFYTKTEIHAEWYFGKHARMFHWGITFGDGDSDAGVLVCAGIPFLFAIYLGIANIWRTEKKEIGFCIHDSALWIHTLNPVNETRSCWPWWKKGLVWHFPWDWNWHSTEILEHIRPSEAKTVFIETAGHRNHRESEEIKQRVSRGYPYIYTLKNGEVQHRTATVSVSRMTWKMRWCPILPFKRSRTSIWINFDAEVGEETGSWKGGCTGCGYDILDYETPLECLRRMEKERAF